MIFFKLPLLNKNYFLFLNKESIAKYFEEEQKLLEANPEEFISLI